VAQSEGPEADEFLEKVYNASKGPPWFLDSLPSEKGIKGMQVKA